MAEMFLPSSTVFRILQREQPEDVYADGAPSAYFTTADNWAVATVVGQAYANLQRIYANTFPQTTDENITDWEDKVFGYRLSASLTLEQKRARILAKLRRNPALHMWNILTTVAGYLPEDVFVQVLEWGCGPGSGWILDVSKLDYDTVLDWEGIHNSDVSPTPTDWCLWQQIPNAWRLDASPLDLETRLGADQDTWEFVSAIQARAYTYEVRIFDYTLSADDTAQLELDLKATEPARSTHVIFQNVDLTGAGLATLVPNVDQFTNLNCIARNSASTTGYVGRKP